MDFHARQYDPQLGRFLSIDPLAYSGGQQVFSPYAAMGNSPGMMIDPNGEMTKYAEPVQDGDYAVHGGMDAVAVRQFMANGAHGMFGKLLMLGMNTILTAANGGGGNSIAIDGNNIYTTGSAAQELFAALFKSDDLSENGGANTAGSNYNTGSISPVDNVVNTGGEGSSGNSGDGWQDLDKATLRSYVATLCNCTGGLLEQLAGKLFENSWNASYGTIGAIDGYRSNNDKVTGGTRNTVPDGIANGRIARVWADIIVKDAAYFEVKAIDGTLYNSTSTGQIRGHITNLAASVPSMYRSWGGAKASAASLTLVTTAGVGISTSMIALASTHNIILYQYTAQYMMSGSSMMVRFRLSTRNGITIPGSYITPPVLLR